MLKFTLFIALATVVYADYERTLSAELDPFCEPSAKCGLCYVQAEGSSDTVHHFWATFRVARRAQRAHPGPGVRLLNVSWHRLQKRDFSVAAFRFSEEPIVSSAVVLSKLWEYKDVGNMAKVDPHLANGTHSVSLGDLVWGDVSGCEGNGSDVVVATFTANSSTSKDDAVYFSKDGTVQVTVRVQSASGRQDQLPSPALHEQQHSAGSIAAGTGHETRRRLPVRPGTDGARRIFRQLDPDGRPAEFFRRRVHSGGVYERRRGSER
uniref:Putative secreted protein n=1 Tax=Ixodes ricinus TaxID=34613 RepID=A0A090X9M6_IXORI